MAPAVDPLLHAALQKTRLHFQHPLSLVNYVNFLLFESLVVFKFFVYFVYFVVLVYFVYFVVLVNLVYFVVLVGCVVLPGHGFVRIALEAHNTAQSRMSCSRSPLSPHAPTMKARYEVASFNELEAVACPCGWSKRAFVTPDNTVASSHLVEISADARTHYHKRLTEIYVILEAEPGAVVELDGEAVPVEPLMAILIRPGCRHRAVGKLKVLVLATPTFDPTDEWFDDEPPTASAVSTPASTAR